MFNLPPDRPAIMGVLNVTPDSFSDGGRFFEQEEALKQGLAMAEAGADIIDVGGESTRPGATAVDAVEELGRVIGVVQALVAAGVPVSIDTSKASVARACLAAGAVVVNDVTALSDPDMANTCAIAECSVCLMHMQGNPRTMQDAPVYEDVVVEVREHLLERARRAEVAGISPDRIWLDPGIGFGKTVEHNLTLLRHLKWLVEAGYPVMVGVSRKSFIGKVLGDLPAEERLEGTLAAQTLAQAAGARVIRTHDVKESVRAMNLTKAVLG